MMTRQLFIRARNPEAAVPLIQEVLAEGLRQSDVRVYGNNAPPELPVKAVRWRSGSRAFLEGSALGLVTIVLIALGAGGGIGLEAALLALLAAALGGIVRVWWVHTQTARLAPQKNALRDGELIIVLAIDDEHSGTIRQHLSQRHPELMILGSDPAGTPPFP